MTGAPVLAAASASGHAHRMLHRAGRFALRAAATLMLCDTAVATTVRVETDVQERFYDVHGASADEIFASIGRKRLGGKAGLSASGLTESEIAFSLSVRFDGASCRVDAITLRANVLVTLPKHSRPSRMDATTRRQWEAYEALVEFHEYRHVEIEFRGVQELQAALERETLEAPGASTDACNARVERLIDEQTRRTRERHEEFHREESAAVRSAQSALLAEIAAIDENLGRQKSEIGRLVTLIAQRDAERARYAARLDDLTYRFGTTLPPAQFTQARALADVIELLTAEMDEAVAARNALVETYNAGLDERRGVQERLSWTR